MLLTISKSTSAPEFCGSLQISNHDDDAMNALVQRSAVQRWREKGRVREFTRKFKFNATRSTPDAVTFLCKLVFENVCS